MSKRKKCVIKGLIVLPVMLSMLSGNAIQAAAESSVAYVYHKHIGNEETMGGCYQQPVFHAHDGDSIVGGSCYEEIVYHVHEGNEGSGGICYETPVYHSHSSSDCYTNRHTHGSDCYDSVSSSEYGCYTISYKDTSEGDYEGADYKYYEMSCGRTIHGTNSAHYHEVLNCDGTGGTNERILTCPKTEKSIESYLFSCTKTEETIDAYNLSCMKSETDIERYERSCGREEGTPYGVITVTKELLGDGYDALLKVEFEDLTGGELQLSGNGFSWYDDAGNCLGGGNSITVSQNGTYHVNVGIQNEDATSDSVSISVNDIREYVAPTPEKETPSPTSIPEDDSYEDDDIDDNEEDIPEDDETDEEEVTVSEPPIDPKPKETIIPTVTPTEIPVQIEAEKITLEKESVSKKAAVRKSPTPTATASATPTIAPIIKKETITVTMDERQSIQEELPKIQVAKEEKSVFSSPVVKVITVTAGTVLLFTGIFLVYYLLRRSVAVFNDDGNGNTKYLGRCMVMENEDGYVITLTEQMQQNSMTNRYLIKPGIFRFGREKEELIVKKQSKRASVIIEKEMIVII